MKITFISDTHNKHNHLTSNAYNNILGGGDVLVHAGDCTSMGKSHEITNFLNWFSMTDFKHKIFIAGNHGHSIPIFLSYQLENGFLKKPFFWNMLIPFL